MAKNYNADAVRLVKGYVDKAIEDAVAKAIAAHEAKAASATFLNSHKATS